MLVFVNRTRTLFHWLPLRSYHTISCRSAAGLMLLMLCMSGCDLLDEDTSVPGNYIGTFEVNATLTDSTCGQGTLAAPGSTDFEVQFSKDKDCFYWTTGTDSVCGTLSSNDTTFAITTESATTVSEPTANHPGCVIWRQDVANGTWQANTDGDAFRAFSGSMSFAYAPGVGSQCSDILASIGVAVLPCVSRYAISGTRIDE